MGPARPGPAHPFFSQAGPAREQNSEIPGPAGPAGQEVVGGGVLSMHNTAVGNVVLIESRRKKSFGVSEFVNASLKNPNRVFLRFCVCGRTQTLKN